MPSSAPLLGRYRASVTGFTTRLPWASLEVGARAAVDAAVLSVVGSAVYEASDVHGGMSPGPAGVLSTDDGQRVFVKLTSRDINEKSYRLYADEVAAYRALEHLPLPMPRLLTTVRHGPWIGLVLTVAPGWTPGPPWLPSALPDVAEACAQVNATKAPETLPPVIERLPLLDGWEALAIDPPATLDGWWAENASRCAQLVRGWEEWTAGSALAHNDCRSDNLLWDGTTTTLVDWNFASAAAPWLDVAQLAADVMASGVVDDSDSSALELSLRVLATVPEDASRFVIALAGMLRRNSGMAPHPGLPTFRQWQVARADRLQPLVESLLTALAS